MTLSQKYYQVFAVIISESHDLVHFTEKLISYMKFDNPNFNERKFREALKKME